MVDAGGHRLYLNCAGEGIPVVILENGLGNHSEVWHQVQPEVEKFTQVCSYDRAGIGRSEAGPMPRTSARFVSELHTLLINAGISSPFVLVGHSVGGLYVRHFARLYPDEVAGLVLVDGSHEDQAERLSLSLEDRERTVASILGRAAVAPEQTDDPEIPTRQHLLAVSDELLHFATKTADEIRAAPPLPVVPLTVLVRGKDVDPERLEIWDEMQREIASRSPLGTLIVVKDAGHYIQRDRPDAIIDAIREMVLKIRR